MYGCYFHEAIIGSGCALWPSDPALVPKMAPYIFTERNGIYIIDLQKTVKKVDEAYDFIRSTVAEGKHILFVGTKKQAQETVKEEAERQRDVLCE